MKLFITSLILYIAILPTLFAQPTPRDPGGVSASSTNVLWLDAFQSTNGIDGQYFSSWSDYSFHSAHGKQSNNSLKPIYRENGINGMPAIDFDGVNDYMQISPFASFDGNKSTQFLVFETSTINPGSINMIFNLDFDEASNLLFSYVYNSNIVGYHKNSLNQPKYSVLPASGTNHIASYLWDGVAGTMQGYKNGTPNALLPGCNNTATGHNYGRIGSYGNNYRFNGKIAEIIYYTSVLNSAERNIVENYLAAKYGIAIAGDIYTHETTHKYDVIGVGQEADGNNLIADGTANLILSVSSMNDGEYVLVGHDNAGYTPNTVDIPMGYNRYEQVWKSTLTGYSGTVDLAFDVSTYGLGSDTAYKLLVDADGVFAVGATEYTGVYAAGTVTFTGVTLTSTSFFTLANADFNVISTGVTNDWHVGTTWNCGCIPNYGSDVTIQAAHNVFIDGQNASVGNLSITGSLSFNSTDTLSLYGDLTNTGTLTSGTGSLSFDGSTAQQITGAVQLYNLTLNNSNGLTINTSAGVQGWLDVISGTLTTGGNLTLKSNSTGTASYMVPDAGEISGQITVERFLDEGESWYLLAPVVANSDLEDWNQEFEMQGFTGTEWPGGGSSVYYFDQNNIVSWQSEGYTVPSSTFDVVDPKVGYEIYVGNDTYATGARTIDNTGDPVLGNVSYTCSYVNKLGDPAKDGWSLITNPYPSNLYWGNVGKTAGYDAAYIKMASGGRVSINNTNILSSGEAFWVHVTSTANINFFTASAGLNTDLTDIYNAKTGPSANLNLEIKLDYTYNATTESDYTYVGFSNDATDAKDQEIDIYKLNNIYTNKPNLSSSNNGAFMERNILSLDNNSIIPLNIITEYPSVVSNNYSLQINNVDELLANNKSLVLEDRLLTIFTEITSDTSYSFNMMDTVTVARFYLHVNSPLTTSKSDITCFGANDGQLIVEGYGATPHDYLWKDEFGATLRNVTNIVGSDSLENLAPGTYSVTVSGNGSFNDVTSTFIINEPLDIVSGFYSSFEYNGDFDLSSSVINDTMEAIVGSTLTFENNSENTTNYSWDFGDLIYSSLENPSHIYSTTGIYKVELSAGNGICDKLSQQYINVVYPVGIEETNLLNDFDVIVKENEILVSLNNDISKKVSFSIYNSVGKVVFSKDVKAKTNHQEKIKLGVSQGVYLITVKDSNGTKTKKIVLK
jgi:hypothetical protein